MLAPHIEESMLVQPSRRSLTTGIAATGAGALLPIAATARDAVGFVTAVDQFLQSGARDC